jgi:hypothetical protein
MSRLARDIEKPCGPDFAAHGGKRIGEGRMRFAIPGRDREAGAGMEPDAEQGDDGEQPQGTGGGARDGFVRPLPLGFHAQVIAHLAEGDLDRPALDEPADDVERRLGGVGA